MNDAVFFYDKYGNIKKRSPYVPVGWTTSSRISEKLRGLKEQRENLVAKIGANALAGRILDVRDKEQYAILTAKIDTLIEVQVILSL